MYCAGVRNIRLSNLICSDGGGTDRTDELEI